MGSLQIKKITLVYGSSDCVKDICTVTKNLDFSDRTYIYVNYDFLTTSYFIFAKGSSYLDIFKSKNYKTETSDCYPVSTFSEYSEVIKRLNLTQNNEKIIEALKVNSGNKRISPCGLKAALYSHIGALAVSKNSQLISLNTKDVIHSRYYQYIHKGDSDYQDVSQGRFFGWYLPAIPAFGTKLLWAIAENGLQGDTTFSFDQSRFVL